MGYWNYSFEHGPSIDSKEFIKSADLIELVKDFGKVTVDFIDEPLSIQKESSSK